MILLFLSIFYLTFFLQVYLLNRRFQQHQSIIWQGQGGVQDRTIYEDSVFAKVSQFCYKINSLSLVSL